MHEYLSQILAVALIFALGGLVKGVAGMGLPTVSMGLLGLLMAPAEAAALVVVPSLVTNVWQFLAGRHRLTLLRRTWPMLLMICVATWAATGLIVGGNDGTAATGLGLALIVYAGIGLARVHFSVRRTVETWLSPTVGVATGVVTGATGILVIPAAPYLEALGFEKDELVEALGLSFTTSTIALAVGLISHGIFHLTQTWTSALCTVPALAGMTIGQAIRMGVDAATFRRLFFIGLLLLGVDLVVTRSHDLPDTSRVPAFGSTEGARKGRIVSGSAATLFGGSPVTGEVAMPDVLVEVQGDWLKERKTDFINASKPKLNPPSPDPSRQKIRR